MSKREKANVRKENKQDEIIMRVLTVAQWVYIGTGVFGFLNGVRLQDAIIMGHGNLLITFAIFLQLIIDRQKKEMEEIKFTQEMSLPEESSENK